MSRYSDFQEEDERNQSIIDEQAEQSDLVCVKNLIPKANALMNKVQYTPYEPKNHYPIISTKLPSNLNNHQYHLDKNNMDLINESLFSHEKLKNDFVKCLQGNVKKMPLLTELLTLKQFYSNKTLIYEKFYTNSEKNNYFATFTLNMGSLCNKGKEGAEKQKLGQSGFIIRNNKTLSLTDRSRTQKNNIFCRPSIDFNSNFQSGNLYRVYQRQINEYDLILQNDINTKGNNQWFFFSVRNVPKGTNVKFNLVNMSKKFSLFEYGMKPAIFSMVKHEKRNVGWVRDGTKISYRQNTQICKQSSQNPYHVLTFEYKFIYEGDIVYFSYCIPYTFSHLCNYLSKKLSETVNCEQVKVKNLGQTLGGNDVNLFQISNPESNHNKKSIWILARQHSGQCTSSFMVEGIINFLLCGSHQANQLLNCFVFKIVPMVNIDGVVHGNTRAQLIGCDSNRKWDDPSNIYHPIVYQIKKRIEKDNVEMVLDLHSHSRKLGTFFYANQSSQFSKLIKVFPMMVCKADDRFDFRSNRFRGGSNQTARKILFDTLNIPFVYTVESSFFGYQKEGDFKIIQYQPNDYREMGESILKTFAQLTKKQKISHLKDERLFLCRKQQLEQEGNLWQKMNDIDEIQSIGSDQDPAEDEFNKKQLQLIIPKIVKKITKKKKKIEPKVRENTAHKKEIKQEDPECLIKKIDKDSYYKKYFSGRCSLTVKISENVLNQLSKKYRPQTKNFSIQVNFPETSVLNKSNMNMPRQRIPSAEKIFERKSLCVIGQKMEEDLTISGLNVGVQVMMAKIFLKSKAELMMSSQNLSRRIIKSHQKGNLMLHNQNNFLNRGDTLQSIMKIFKK